MFKNPSFSLARQVLCLLAVFAFRIAAAGAPVPVQLPAAAASETIRYGRFGAVDVYRRAGGESRNVVLFLSGDGGWDDAVAGMASRLADTGAIVAAIDTGHYLRQVDAAPAACISPAVDLENLSHYLQSKLALRSYLQPTLIGYAAGAALAFATLAEAPDGLFRGGLSIDYRPDLALKKPLCNKSAQRRSFSATAAPTNALAGHWSSLQTDSGRLAENWVQLDAAFRRVTAPQPAERKVPALAVPVADLPLIIVPAYGREADWFGIFLTGDGGWVGLDKGISAELAKHGIPIVGWDSLKYFWTPRTPAGAAKDLERVLRHYAREFGKSRALLIGYSQGADTLPFMVNRLPDTMRSLVGLTTLLGLSDDAVFEFHLTNWLGEPSGGLPTAPELKQWKGSPYLCLYGEDDTASACKRLTGHDGEVLKMPGGHHFGGSYAAIAAAILGRLPPGR